MRASDREILESMGGCKYPVTVHARIPEEVYEVAKTASRMLGVPLSQMIRAGIGVKVAEVVDRSMTILDDPKTPGRTKLKLVRFMRRVAWAGAASELPAKAMNELRLRDFDVKLEREQERRKRRRDRRSGRLRIPDSILRAHQPKPQVSGEFVGGSQGDGPLAVHES